MVSVEKNMTFQNSKPNPREDLPAINIPRLMRLYDLRPDKRLGQNFLVEHNALRKIIEVAELDGNEIVLEIGPGLGSLTRFLALNSSRVIAVELDRRLIPALQDVLSPFDNIEILQGDILSFPPEQLIKKDIHDPQPRYSVVANIPYNITSVLIRHLLEASLPPEKLVLTIQKEVAERICNTSGKMNLLALSVQVYGEPKLAAKIPASAFYPSPKVDSAVVRVDLHTQPVVPLELSKTFFQLAKAGFSQKRKTLRNSISAGMHWETKQTEEILKKSGIDPQRRAETLSIEDWLRITQEVVKK
jgi:16S rRNA (adenine1518-N6/adenine1519-N6)-dimethyltransferase